ncbi:polyphosphate kinase 2 family protein [Methylobacterium tardum]|uniref:PPK2 family polyphosphate kinase n=1 Tax=Methylobacterium tardum TaxID=374432 RepID=UPI00201FC3CD|nr:PPK2 family polyphosphate kinase [Methylobacterium tardum]URD34770.1 polyphosphate kinase 2 family protein [Methylobacterium tardum]
MSKKHGKHHRGQKRDQRMTDGDDLHGTAHAKRPSTARWASTIDANAESIPAALGAHREVSIPAAAGITVVEPGTRIDLGAVDADADGGLDKDWAKEALGRQRERIIALQERLYAERARSLLLVFQAIDTGGKDGTIRAVLKGVNPQGCTVASFKVPSSDERDHDFLWRYHARTPGRGMIGVFNRSHYEDVLVVRVKGLVPDAVWQSRYGRINDFEQLLTESGTTILKFFLHISKAEQKKRLEARIADPEKHWKFDPADLVRAEILGCLSAGLRGRALALLDPRAPWLVVPANHKWFRNYVIAKTVADTLEAMNPRFPEAAKGIADLTVPD